MGLQRAAGAGTAVDSIGAGTEGNFATAVAEAGGVENSVAIEQWKQWVAAQAMAGQTGSAIVASMVAQGWTQSEAQGMVQTMLAQPAPFQQAAQPALGYYNPQTAADEAQRRAAAIRTANRANARRNMLIGGAVCIVGTVITVGTYTAASESGGHYTIAWGAIVFGAIQFFRGLAGRMSA